MQTSLLLLAMAPAAAWPNETARFVSLGGGAYPHARCLDGSPSGYYIRKALRAEASSSWLFLLDGGGICTTREDCISRSSTDLGSSKGWPLSYNVNATDLTTPDSRNPFAAWNVVYLQYCDGSMHSGARVSATNDTFGLYFSGHHTIAAVLQHLSLHDMLNASEGVRVVFAGGSAGGVGVFSNIEYVAEVLPHAKVLGAPIGGFVPEIEWFRGPFSTVPPDDLRTPAFVRLVSLYQSFLPRGCVTALGPESWRCELPAFSYSHITVPLFMIEAITDSVVLSGFEGVVPESLLTRAGADWAAEYGHNSSANMARVRERDGLFGASCLLHCGFTLRGPLIRGQNAIVALHEWAEAHFRGDGDRGGHHYKDGPDKKGRYWPPSGELCPLKPTDGQELSVHI